MDKIKMGLMCAFLLGVALAPISSNAMNFRFLKKRKTSEDGSLSPSSAEHLNLPKQRSAGFFSKKKIKSRVLPNKSRKIGRKDIMTLPHSFKKYNDPLSSQDEKDIHYVVSSCANKSSLGIAMAQAEIMSALMRIQSLHPFNFLEVIYSDPKLKTEFAQMQSRGWVWNLFVARLKEIFTHLKSKGLFLDKDIENFSSIIGIEKSTVSSLIEENRWDELLNVYLDSIS